MARPGYFVIARRNNGWVVRWLGGNNVLALSSGDQMYASKTNAKKAILSVARAFWRASQPTIAADELGTLFVSDGREQYVEVRYVDERTHA